MLKPTICGALTPKTYFPSSTCFSSLGAGDDDGGGDAGGIDGDGGGDGQSDQQAGSPTVDQGRVWSGHRAGPVRLLPLRHDRLR